MANNILEPNEDVFVVWQRRCPNFEKRYEDSVIRILADYGKASTQFTDARGKVLGPGYEAYILAFFIGLYSGRKLSMTPDPSEKKDFGWPIENWSGVSRGGRRKYDNLRRYMFIALVAKTDDINWLSVDEGLTPLSDAVSKLIKTMEEYANYGFSVMEDKLKDKDYFYSNRSFLDIFLEIVTSKKPASQKATQADPL